ncbi:SURF4 family-domain-containing protein [Phycomyces nitens]|nr:SURF4 family-domain-containing protein [Phycomyces nitens]
MRTAIQSSTHRVESLFEALGKPLKPHLPAMSRFMVVATFYEDAFRIILQWHDQRMYLEKARHFPSAVSPLFLGFNVMAMLLCSTCIISKRVVGPSVGVLAAVVAAQAIAYGLVFDMLFFLRNLSVTGGLLLCLSESILRRRSSKSVFASLPQLSESERHKYFQLAGRVLLVLLFIGFIFNGTWNMLRIIVSVMGLLACGMVVVGFRAKWSATFLVSLLCVMNFLVNNWWSAHHSNYKRDFLKYDFFQTLSIMGGLLLLISIGPGGLSYDEKKKEY